MKLFLLFNETIYKIALNICIFKYIKYICNKLNICKYEISSLITLISILSEISLNLQFNIIFCSGLVENGFHK